MKNFEQVSGDDHQVSLAEGGYVQMGGEGVRCVQVGISRGVGGYPLTCNLSHDAYTYDVTYPTPPSPCGQTDICENITFPQLLLRAVKM